MDVMIDSLSLSQLAARLAVCRCCLRLSFPGTMVERSIEEVACLIPANIAAHGCMLFCCYCSTRLTQCRDFISAFEKSTELLQKFQSCKSRLPNEQEPVEEIASFANSCQKLFLTQHSAGHVNVFPESDTCFNEDIFTIVHPRCEKKTENDDINVECILSEVDDKDVEEINNENCNIDKKILKKQRETKKEKSRNKKIAGVKPNIKTRIKRRDIEAMMAEMKFKIIFLTREQQLQEIKENKKSEKYLKSPYKCNICSKSFVLEESYENHVFKHSKSRGAHECDICGLRYARSELLQCHRRDHERHFVCTLCGVTVKSSGECSRHYARCGGYGGHVKCKLCSKLIRDVYSLQKHLIRIHYTAKKFTCDYCNKNFKQKISLQIHIRKHTGERPHACTTCDARFASHFCLKQHALVHAARDEHYCVECDRTYRSASSLRQHLARSPRHVTSRSQFKHACSVCNKRYYSRVQLTAHVASAHKPPEQRVKYPCPHCPKEYARPHAMRRHERRAHLGVPATRSHACTHCGKTFTERFRLVNHARTHTGERPFTCDQCPATFAHKSAVYGHRKVKHPPLGKGEGATGRQQ